MVVPVPRGSRMLRSCLPLPALPDVFLVPENHLLIALDADHQAPPRPFIQHAFKRRRYFLDPVLIVADAGFGCVNVSVRHWRSLMDVGAEFFGALLEPVGSVMAHAGTIAGARPHRPPEKPHDPRNTQRWPLI